MEQAVFQWDTSYYNITVQLYGILLYSNLLYYIKYTIEAVPSGGNFMKHWLVSAVSVRLTIVVWARRTAAIENGALYSFD